MGRILAIDYGRKRTGLAVTDPLQIIASGLTTVSSHTCLDFLKNYCSENDVESFVVGEAKQLNNQPSESMRFINPFVKKLKQLFPNKEIFMVDERFTSKIAQQTMIDGGLKKMQRQNKALIDTISATLILQAHLEQKNRL